jgi:hypothetical protein
MFFPRRPAPLHNQNQVELNTQQQAVLEQIQFASTSGLLSPPKESDFRERIFRLNNTPTLASLQVLIDEGIPVSAEEITLASNPDTLEKIKTDLAIEVRKNLLTQAQALAVTAAITTYTLATVNLARLSLQAQ